MYKIHPNDRAEIYHTVSRLCPRDLVGCGKIRFGKDEDGGYVLADALSGVEALLSYGVGHDVSFERGFAERNIKVFMFDHTVNGPQEDHVNYRFFREGISRDRLEELAMYTLRDHIERIGLRKDARSVLKLDVEGAEIGVFAAVGQDELQ